MNSKSCLSIAVMALGAWSAQAADVSWSSFNITTSASDVSTTGTLIASKSGAPTTDYTVNGVLFSQGQILDTTTHNDNISSRVPATLEAAYRSLLQSGSRNSNSANQTITFTGLEIGKNYQIQIWASDSSTTVADTGIILSPGTPQATAILYEVVNNGPGQYALGVFTADATSQAITLRRYTGLLGTPVASNQNFVNAVQLREIIIGSVDAATSTVSASPASVPADGTTASTVTVTLKDNGGNPVPGKVVSLAGIPGNATIQTGNNTSNAAGVVTFTVKSGTVATVQFTATGDSVAITQTVNVDFTSPLTDPVNSTVVASPATLPADGVTESIVTVTLKNTSGLPLAGKLVSLAKTAGPGTPAISPATGTTNANGVTSFTVKSGAVGTAEFTATCDTDSVTLTADAVAVNFVAPDAAGLAVYEGFDYPLGVLTGNNGGTGFSAGWTSPEAAFICQVYDQTGGTLVTWDNVVSGMAVSSPPRYIASVNTSNPGSTAARVLASDVGTLAGADKVLWMGAVFHYVDTNTSAGLNIGLSSGGSVTDRGRQLNTAGIDFIGVTNYAQASSSWNNRINTTIVDDHVIGTGYSGPHAQTLGTQALATTEDLLVVMKFTFGASDRVEAAFFTESQVAGAGFSEANFYSSPSYISTIYAAGIDESAINTISYTQQRGLNALDEIRLGNTFKDLIGLASITSFEAAGATVVINQSTKTIAVEVPFGTNLATLAPTFTLSSGTCNQTSGATPSPTFAVQNPATYTVTDTSTDPDTINSYTVAVTVLPEPPVIATLVINLGTSPGGTAIAGGTFIGSGPTNLPIPTLPPGSILRSIDVDVQLEATDNQNFASDLAILVDTSAPYTGDNFSLGITSSSATASFSPAETLTWASGGAGVGTSLTETRTDNEWTGDIDLATTGLFLGNAFGSALAGGTWSGTITLTYDDVSGGTSFATWSGGAAANGDANGDGVKNAVAYALGAQNVSENAISRLPSFNNSGPSNVVFTFNRSDAAAADPSATITVEYGSDLSGWTTAVNGVGGVSINDSAVPSPGLHTVGVTIPKSGGKLFARLKVAVSP